MGVSIEQWVDIIGYEGLYQISSKGRVKSLSRKIKTGNGGWRILPERIMKPAIGTNKNVFVSLCKGNKYKTNLLHRLIGVAFLPNPENKPTINHKDGNRLNNKINNLEWATYSENNKHAVLTGLNDPIKNLPINHKKLMMLDMKGEELQSFNSITDAATFVNGKVAPISAVCNNKKHCKTAYGFKWKFV